MDGAPGPWAARPGGAEGRIVMHDDFDDPLPADLRRAFGIE
jgi:hypothetical protein